ncbi:MAG: hypothetical protein R3D67_21945 [Hyphomicrobiaceae bacterium]
MQGAGANRRGPVGRRGVVAGLLTAGLWPRSLAAASLAKPPLGVKTWLRTAEQLPLALPFDYVGIHTDHGLGGPTPKPTYPYDAVRSHDADDGSGKPVLQWANIEVAPGAYNWRALDAWIAANPGKTRIFVLCGCPVFYQKYPGEPWPYPDLPGGGSPPKDVGAAARFISAIVRRYPGKIHFVEPWNEPNFAAGRRRPFEDRWGPWMGKPGFFTGTAGELAGMARAIRGALPADVRLMIGAWEGQDGEAGLGNSLVRFAHAPDGGGGFGRDHAQALSVHSYTYHNDPNKMIAELLGYEARFREAGFQPGLPRYVSECGVEAPEFWTAERPSIEMKVRCIKRWFMIPAALGYLGVYLYKHSIMRTLGDPAREPRISEAIGEMRRQLSGSIVRQAAELADGSIWLAFSDGRALQA